jgi:PPOX class probable F420-dependent enzyme
MTEAEVQELLGEAQRAQLATLNRDGSIHLVPLTFYLDDGSVAVWTPRNSRKVSNLRRDPTATCLVEVGANYYEFRAAQIYGTAEVIDDPDASRQAGEALFYKYGEGEMTDVMSTHIAEMAGDRVVIVVRAKQVVTWDHRKLASVRSAGG